MCDIAARNGRARKHPKSSARQRLHRAALLSLVVQRVIFGGLPSICPLTEGGGKQPSRTSCPSANGVASSLKRFVVQRVIVGELQSTYPLTEGFGKPPSRKIRAPQRTVSLRV